MLLPIDDSIQIEGITIPIRRIEAFSIALDLNAESGRASAVIQVVIGGNKLSLPVSSLDDMHKVGSAFLAKIARTQNPSKF